MSHHILSSVIENFNFLQTDFQLFHCKKVSQSGIFRKICNFRKTHAMVFCKLKLSKLARINLKNIINTKAVPTLEINAPLLSILCAPTNTLSI